MDDLFALSRFLSRNAFIVFARCIADRGWSYEVQHWASDAVTSLTKLVRASCYVRVRTDKPWVGGAVSGGR